MHSPTSSQAVKEMFDRISPTYDILNWLLSLGVHRSWAKKAVHSLKAYPDGTALDLCTGTGALVPYISPRFRRVVAADIAPKMLEHGRRAFSHLRNVEWIEADALRLPFEDECFDATTVAYGVRNWPDPAAGLGEVYRVTKPGGLVSVLEFGQPTNRIWKWIFGLYSRWIIPTVGKLVSGDGSAYRYLPETSARFPCGKRFEDLMRSVGWTPKGTQALMGGIAYVYIAQREFEQVT